MTATIIHMVKKEKFQNIRCSVKDFRCYGIRTQARNVRRERKRILSSAIVKGEEQSSVRRGVEGI